MFPVFNIRPCSPFLIPPALVSPWRSFGLITHHRSLVTFSAFQLIPTGSTGGGEHRETNPGRKCRETIFRMLGLIFMPAENTPRRGFTLLELLIVVSIIGLLTALLMTAMKSADTKAKVALATTELGQMESAIQDYRTRLGFYPPDNRSNAAMAPLYFELLGTTNDGNTYVTLDASGKISLTDINAEFSRQGFANSSRHAHSTDETGAPMSFFNQPKSKQVGEPVAGQPQIKILVCSISWPEGDPAAPIPGTILNPWRYVSSQPPNNTGSYDLWVDLPIGKKIYRVSNWSKQPEILP